jgi:hypothetical protein
MEWEADPNAVPFYERMGGRRVGETTGDWGRPLPVMRLELEPQREAWARARTRRQPESGPSRVDHQR